RSAQKPHPRRRFPLRLLALGPRLAPDAAARGRHSDTGRRAAPVRSTSSASLFERGTRLVLRFRWLVVCVWMVVLIAGALLSTRLSPLLSNDFSVPGTDSARAALVLQRHFGDRSDGSYLIVFKVARPVDGQLLARLQARVDS